MPELNIDINELRSRWTIELNSLGRRSHPSQEQVERKRDLQVFLCFIDPLRKYEQDWRNMKGLEKRLTAELVLQSSVSSKQYKDTFYTNLLIAMTGKPVANPSELCQFNLRVRNICEDHGERLDNVLADMHARNYIRKDYKSGEYSVSTVGTLLMERNSVKKLKNKNTSQATSMFNALNKDVQDKLCELHALLNISSYDASTRKLSEESQIREITNNKNAKLVVVNKKVPAIQTPKKIVDVISVLQDLESKGTSATAIIQTLVQKKVITITKDDNTVFDPIVSPCVWTSVIEVEEFPGVTFTAESSLKKGAKQGSSQKLIDHIWIKYKLQKKI